MDWNAVKCPLLTSGRDVTRDSRSFRYFRVKRQLIESSVVVRLEKALKKAVLGYQQYHSVRSYAGNEETSLKSSNKVCSGKPHSKYFPIRSLY
ncbi:hypothetical protein HUJ04_007109 [Dendroctonus ponderosae]|nr:hypothetical protein HUJ04_007109 [Dendroctonus ponderosae]